MLLKVVFHQSPCKCFQTNSSHTKQVTFRLSSVKLTKNWNMGRPFPKRLAITKVINHKCKSNFWQIFPCLIKICAMLLLNRRLSLIIKLKLHSYIFELWKLLILHRNQKGSLLSPVYKHLKGIHAYIFFFFFESHLLSKLSKS